MPMFIATDQCLSSVMHVGKTSYLGNVTCLMLKNTIHAILNKNTLEYVTKPLEFSLQESPALKWNYPTWIVMLI